MGARKKDVTAGMMRDELAAEAALRGGRLVSAEYLGSYEKHEWECAHGHRWFATAGNIRSKGSWCPVCAVEKSRRSRMMTEFMNAMHADRHERVSGMLNDPARPPGLLEPLAPLHNAVRSPRVTRLLLARGADIRAADKARLSPLEIAREKASKFPDHSCFNEVIALLEEAELGSIPAGPSAVHREPDTPSL